MERAEGNMDLIPYFRHQGRITASQCAAVEKEPNKCRKRDICVTPHPRRLTNWDMRTDGYCVYACVCVCVNKFSPYVFSLYDGWRQTRGVFKYASYITLKTNSEWKNSFVGQIQQKWDVQPPGKGNKKAV